MNKYDSYNFKRKAERRNIHTSSSSPVETPLSTRRILSAPNYSDNFFYFFFAIKQMRQLITISFKLYHQINVRGKWRKGQLIPSYWQRSKFTEGDVIATEAKYHRNCLARLCNVSFEYISKNRKCNCLFLQNQHYKINNS